MLQATQPDPSVLMLTSAFASTPIDDGTDGIHWEMTFLKILTIFFQEATKG